MARSNFHQLWDAANCKLPTTDMNAIITQLQLVVKFGGTGLEDIL